MEKEENSRNNFKWLLYIVAVFFIVLIFLLFAGWSYAEIYEGKIFRGVEIGQTDMGGKTKSEVEEIINNKISQINQKGIKVSYQGETALITPTVESLSGDWAYELINFDKNKTIQNAYSIGRDNNTFLNFTKIIDLLISKQNIAASYKINEEEITKTIEEQFSDYDIPAQNASLNYENGKFSIKEEKIGKIIDYKKALEDLKNDLKNLSNQEIILTTITEYPTVHKYDCLNIEKEAENFIANAPFALKINDKEYPLSKDEIADLLSLKNEQGNIKLDFDDEKLKVYIEENISPENNIEPIEARFEIKDGRVTEFQASKNGYKINLEKSIAQIKEDILTNNATSTELIGESIKSELATSDVNDLGIKEKIGIGQSDFSGSPANRRQNIRTGASKVNGLIIKPGEEFSLVANLGEVDATNGFLPELVIKGNKTVPEYGGGLCQIATTLFRAAIDSGLPILERRNHSYRVSYYEPAGFDAAVYIPKPDVRFLNDTENSILIETVIDGNKLYFHFWGTKDGRKVEYTKPVIYNITSPGPTKIIETLDLEPGEKKCTEHAHNGSDAYFDYIVTYANDEIKEERFTSHYVPWQEVCLLGVEELNKEEDNNNGEEKNSGTINEENVLENNSASTTSP